MLASVKVTDKVPTVPLVTALELNVGPNAGPWVARMPPAQLVPLIVQRATYQVGFALLS